MAEPSLAYTATIKTKQYEFMMEKLWFSFSQQDTLFDAWKVWANTSGSTAQQAIAKKFTGRTMDFIVAIKAISGFPGASDYVATATVPQIGFVTKWGGACLKDWSSGMGGWCMWETNDTPFYDCGHIDAAYAVPSASAATLVCGDNTCIGGVGSGSVQSVQTYCNTLNSSSSPPCLYEKNAGGPVNIFWSR